MPIPDAAPAAAGASPAMAQWFAAKSVHPDALLFFRMGDFYELFFADAEAAAGALDIALTYRGEHAGSPVPMCGVPAHASESYLARLIRRGFRVAVVEQMEEARHRDQRKGGGKAPIRREVVRLVTPGTLTEDSLLDASRPNLLLALAGDRGGIGAAWLDVSTGGFETEAVTQAGLPALLGRLDAAEILAPTDLPLGEHEPRRGPPPLPRPAAAARRAVAEAFGAASLDAFGEFSDVEAAAAAAALDYVSAANAGRLPRLSRPVPAGTTAHMGMDAATRASLELLRARDGGTAHTLLAAVQRTVTAPGTRLLAGWLSAPLLDPVAIADRQDGWAWLAQGDGEALRRVLRGTPDMARALGRLSVGRGSPRDLAAIAQGLRAAGEAAAALDGGLTPPRLLREAATALAPDPTLGALLDTALADPAPLRLEDGAIAPGFDGELDAERALRDDSRRTIAALTLDYAQRYGVASLKIRHHAQLGYHVEAPSAAVETLRAHPDLRFRQAMAQGARFTTVELSELDRRIADAADRAAARERVVFAHLVQQVLARADAITACAGTLALLDVLHAAAHLARPGRWVRPAVEAGSAFCIAAGRHPVVEAALAEGPGREAFVANPCDLSPGRRVMLLTGPNMAGKSTFLRQCALIVILAQAGLPVPAESARIGVVDRLYSRVGAADDLARGRSTFMVEMTETAAILNGAGPQSLVVVDEIGRGTGTQDGLAIALAVLEALHDQIRCRAIYATHFHELARLGTRLPQLCSHAMKVREWKGGVVFQHEVGEGAAGRSWGVHVARLAGVPAPVVRRAAGLLARLERDDAGDLPLFAANTLPAVEADPVQDALEQLDPDILTPREALDAVYRLKAIFASRKHG